MDEGQLELNHRVIAAGDVTLDTASNDGRVLADLHKRLCGLRLDVCPPCATGAKTFRSSPRTSSPSCARVRNVARKELTESAQSMLAALPWRRGNGTPVAKAPLESLVFRAQGTLIRLQDVLAHVQLDAHAAWFPVGFSLRDARARFEREYIAAVLAQHHGRIPDAARTLGIQRSNLYRKMGGSRSI